MEEPKQRVAYGAEKRFPPPRLCAGYGSERRRFPECNRYGRDAPEAGIGEAQIKSPDSTRCRHPAVSAGMPAHAPNASFETTPLNRRVGWKPVFLRAVTLGLRVTSVAGGTPSNGLLAGIPVRT